MSHIGAGSLTGCWRTPADRGPGSADEIQRALGDGPTEKQMTVHEAELASLRRAYAELQGRLNESIAQRAASAEVMRLIGASPGDADLSLRRIAEITERLFGASSVSLLIADGERWGRTIRVGAGSERIAA